MIIVTLMGGLGNQMFQYAAGRSLSLELGKKLMLDDSFLQKHQDSGEVTPREFELSVFRLKEELITYKPVFGLGKTFPYRINKLIDPLTARLRSTKVVTDELDKDSFRKISAN